MIDNVATYVIVFYTNKYLSFCSLLRNQFGMYYWQTIVFQLFSEQLTGLETIQREWTTESTTIDCHWKIMEPTFFLKSQTCKNALEIRSFMGWSLETVTTTQYNVQHRLYTYNAGKYKIYLHERKTLVEKRASSELCFSCFEAITTNVIFPNNVCILRLHGKHV